MKIYAVRNKDGKFFRPIGYGGYGQNWVDSIEKDKLYTKIGQAKSRVTFFTRNYPNFKSPDLLEFDLGEPTVLDMKDYAQKAIKKIETKELQRKRAIKEANIKYLENEKSALEAKLKRLKS